MTELNQQNSLLGKIAAYTEILAKDPKSTIFVSLSEAYRKMGMLDDARQVIEKGLEIHPDFSPAHIVLARILCQQGEYAGSEASFQHALEFDSENLAALVGYSRLNILLGQEATARELLIRARALSPADPVINKLLLSLPEEAPAVSLEDEVLSSSAAIPVEEAELKPEVKISSAPPLVSSTLAELYLKQGLNQQALDVYRQLSADDPDNLLFRRKIRDLEDDFVSPETEQDFATDNESEIADDDQSTGSVTEDQSLDDFSAESNAQEEVFAQDAGFAVAQCQQNQSDEKVIATLNRWLDSIRQRREDV